MELDWLGYYRNLLGNRYGKVKTLCRGGSWLYTESGKVKICVPELKPKGEGIPLPNDLASEMLEDEVLFLETDRGLIAKDGMRYIFYPEGQYELVWKK